ncbi:MAG: hypothetical protein RLZ81_1901 [Pseudomonadota bacterium]|jgi:hypothetical protein
MIKVVLVVLEWAIYAVTAIAIGSVLRIPMPERSAAAPDEPTYCQPPYYIARPPFRQCPPPSARR